MALPPDPARAVVDALIDERAPRLRARPRVWALVRALGLPLLGYERAVEMARALRELEGAAVMDWAQDYLSLRVEVSGLEHVPESGPVMISSNHPGGVPDGVAAWQALKARRPDLIFFANRDALRVAPGLVSRVIPVEWRPMARDRTSARDTLRAAMEALNAGRCVVVFPAGRMAHWSWRQRRLAEPDWAPAFISLARRFDAPAVPLGVRQRMPLLYYALSLISTELRDMTVFHAFMAQKNKRYRLEFGEPLPSRALPGQDAAAAAHMRALSEALAWGKPWNVI
ncbi:1-acyl-sn-glycerol-3-phosphate acyltransferase [Alkalicaulis satelles]|nr:1-acyl-sn-glycerol-3-phosphate acyltransferase [Alkalicaulis satelles]